VRIVYTETLEDNSREMLSNLKRRHH